MIEKPYAGECVLIREPVREGHGSAVQRPGDALGKAVQTRGCAYGWCRACDPDERDDSDCFPEGQQVGAFGMMPKALACMNPWSEAKRSYEAAPGGAASYVSELAVNTGGVLCTRRFSPCGLVFGTPMELAASN